MISKNGIYYSSSHVCRSVALPSVSIGCLGREAAGRPGHTPHPQRRRYTGKVQHDSWAWGYRTTVRYGGTARRFSVGVQHDSSAWGYNASSARGYKTAVRQFSMGVQNDSSTWGYNTTVQLGGTQRQFDIWLQNDGSAWGYKTTVRHEGTTPVQHRGTK